MTAHKSRMGADTTQRTELITAVPAEALAALLDIDPPDLSDGAPLPALWHWIYLLERCRQTDLGRDGHPTRGIPKPPRPNQLRMFAGGRVMTHGALRFGRPATRITRVTSTYEKQGRSGPLTFLTVRHDIEQDASNVIVDEQHLVYRLPGSRLSPPARDDQAADAVVSEEATRLELAIDEVLLFRFSALTYNAHRIHYDGGFAAEEGYPGLVVHGPLQALMMGELLRRSDVPLLGQDFTYRLVAPMVGKQTLTVTVTAGTGSGGPGAIVRDANRTVTATSTVTPIADP